MRRDESTWMLRELDGNRWLRYVSGHGDRPFTNDPALALIFATKQTASAMARRVQKSLWRIEVEPVIRSAEALSSVGDADVAPSPDPHVSFTSRS